MDTRTQELKELEALIEKEELDLEDFIVQQKELIKEIKELSYRLDKLTNLKSLKYSSHERIIKERKIVVLKLKHDFYTYPLAVMCAGYEDVKVVITKVTPTRIHFLDNTGLKFSYKKTETNWGIDIPRSLEAFNNSKSLTK
jgi:hypothetical protein